MVASYVLDTSVIIEKIRQGYGVWDNILTEASENNGDLIISTVTLAELWAGGKMDNKKVVNEVEELIKPIIRITVDDEVAKMAGKLARKKLAFDFDAIIAATALVYKAQLATLNQKHFEKIEGLKLYK